MGLYTDKILDHARHPRKFGRIVNPHLQFEEVNPLCGDRIRVELRLTEKSEVLEARFSGEMCAIAKGSGGCSNWCTCARFKMGHLPIVGVHTRRENYSP